MPLPTSDIIDAVYAKLDAAGVPVRYSGAGGEAPAEYVVFDVPAATERDTKTTQGYRVTLVLRCHTEAPTGQLQPKAAHALAESADDAMGRALDLGSDHACFYVSSPSITEQQPPLTQGITSHDVILTYTLLTQSL